MRSVDENHKKQRQYAYRDYRVTIDRDTKGKETGRETMTWDVVGLEGSTYKKLVMRNDKALSAKEQKQEEEKLRKEEQIRKEENSGKRPRRIFSLSYSFFLPYQKLAAIYDMKPAGEGEVDGRHTFLVTATPKADFRPATDDEKEALNYSLKLGLEDSEAFPVRIDGDVSGEHSRMQKGSHFRQDSMRLNDAWVAKTVTFDFSARIVKLFTARGVMTETFSDYHKFQVDSNIVEFTEKR